VGWWRRRTLDLPVLIEARAAPQRQVINIPGLGGLDGELGDR
jgi:hypothetical protein